MISHQSDPPGTPLVKCFISFLLIHLYSTVKWPQMYSPMIQNAIPPGWHDICNYSHSGAWSHNVFIIIHNKILLILSLWWNSLPCHFGVWLRKLWVTKQHRHLEISDEKVDAAVERKSATGPSTTFERDLHGITTFQVYDGTWTNWLLSPKGPFSKHLNAFATLAMGLKPFPVSCKRVHKCLVTLGSVAGRLCKGHAGGK